VKYAGENMLGLCIFSTTGKLKTSHACLVHTTIRYKEYRQQLTCTKKLTPAYSMSTERQKLIKKIVSGYVQ